MMQTNKLVTLILVSYHSKKNLKSFLDRISSRYNIIVTENSLDIVLKNEMEKNYSNVRVLIPNYNLGNGGGINFALEHIKTKYAFYLDIDIELSENSILNLINVAESLNNWAIIAPNLENYIYHSDYFIQKNIKNNLSKMKFVEGCALFFNLEKIKKYGFYDEKIFLYYEEDDLYFKYISAKLDIILCEKIFIKHIGNSSTDIEHKFEIELNRNWHYMWSKFYYYKKNYSYLRGLRETFGQLIRSSFKLCIFYAFNSKKFLIYKNRTSGLINSYLNRPSWRRPHIK